MHTDNTNGISETIFIHIVLDTMCLLVPFNPKLDFNHIFPFLTLQ